MGAVNSSFRIYGAEKSRVVTATLCPTIGVLALRYKQAYSIRAMSRLDSEVFAIPLEDGRYLVYAPLRRAAFVANSAAVNTLADVRDSDSPPSHDGDNSFAEFLRRIGLLNAGVEEPPITTCTGLPRPTAVTLLLTTACNLRCAYCYAAAGDQPARSMSIDTAKRAIDFVATNAAAQGKKCFEVAYHGAGEPTANWTVLTESFRYAQKRAAELALSLTTAAATNGVLSLDKVEWIIAHLNGVSVSFDGIPEVHDKYRLTVQGCGSSGLVMRTMRSFDNADFDYGVRMTVTQDHTANLPDSVEFICANFCPRRILIEPAYQLGRWLRAESAETKEFISAYRDAQLRANRYEMEICYSAARLDVLTDHFCGSTRDLFVLSPDGDVSSCYEVYSRDQVAADCFFYGAPDPAGAGYRFSLPVLESLRAQSVDNRAFCRGCFAKWHCAGDCYHKWVAAHGRGEFSGSARCHITRELLKDQILRRIASSGCVVWCEALTSSVT